MDAAASQSQTTFNTTNSHSRTASRSNSTTDLVQLNASNLIKNKRKNFNPRCSAMTGDHRDMASSTEATDLTKRSSSMTTSSAPMTFVQTSPVQLSPSSLLTTTKIEPTIMVNNNQTPKRAAASIRGRSRAPSQGDIPSDIESMSINWRRLLEHHRSSVAASNLTIADVRQTANGLDDNNLYKVPNNNFTLSRPPFTSSASGSGLPNHTSVKMESRTDFTYNAYGVVQEFLNAYGIAISPSDIVEAFKIKQGIGVFRELTMIPPQIEFLMKLVAFNVAYQNFKSEDNFGDEDTNSRDSITLSNSTGDNLYFSNSNSELTESFIKTTNQECDTDFSFFLGGLLQPPTPPRSPATTSDNVSVSNSQSEDVNGAIDEFVANTNAEYSKLHNSRVSNPLGETTVEEVTISPANITSSATVVNNTSPPHITLAPVAKLMGISSQSYTEPSSSNQQFESNSNYNSFDCGDERTETTTSEKDDDYDDQPQQMQKQQLQRAANTIRSSIHSELKDCNSDRDTYSPKPYDLVRINDDSNISTAERQSDDQGSDDFGCNSSNPIDFDSARISVKNVENLLDKCSLGLFSPILQLAQLQNEDKQIHVEGIKNLTKYASYVDCKSEQCQLENLREHYHCYDLPCFGKMLSKKEEIIRHLKWHKKRNESLNHGFLRFSSSDDCSSTFGPNCTHNRKQTHYHCFQPNCDKVYISTSDVQMHSNYHRKDSAIFQEGFQRYRATEECNADYCIFSGQRTTHFHCRRDNCKFTFKNKADMEKHKSYHIKDLQLARDGFKKFLKTEACPYERCRFSRICNHIHCVRENCYYVLHSSGQLLSHKRKHERMDSEQAYRRFKMLQKTSLFGADLSQMGGKNLESGSKPSTPSTSSSAAISPDLQLATATHSALATELTGNFTNVKTPESSLPRSATVPNLGLLYGAANNPLEFIQQMQQRQQQLFRQSSNSFTDTGHSSNDKSSHQSISPVQQQITQIDLVTPEKYLNSSLGNPNTPTFNNDTPSNGSNFHFDDIEHLIRQYFTDNCSRQVDPADLQQQTEPLNLNLRQDRTNSNTGNNTERMECFLSTNEPHLHCLVKDCEAVIPRVFGDIAEHMRMHELNRNVETLMQNSNLMQITSIEGFFNRKRGRPPKNRVVEVYNNTQQSPQAIFTSFKLEKNLSDPSTTQSSRTIPNASFVEELPSRNPEIGPMYVTKKPSHVRARICQANENCFVENCGLTTQLHFHCNKSESCKFATVSGESIQRHINESHRDCVSPVVIERIRDFKTGVDCNVAECSNRLTRDHSHCTKCWQLIPSQANSQFHIHICGAPDYKQSNTSLSLPNMTMSFSNAFSSASSPGPTNAESESQTLREDYGNLNFSNSLKSQHDSIYSNDGEGGAEPEEDLDIGYNSERKSASSEEDPVSVVRAAGTYFPENSDTNEPSTPAASDPQPDATPEPILTCLRPFCKLKRKPHWHCDVCNQAFSDNVKLKLHRLKHSAKLGQMTDAENQETTMGKNTSAVKPESSASSLNDHNEQPQDLSILGPPNLATAMTSSVSPLLPPNFVENISMQNLHLAHLALYQQNQFYYQSFYPFLGSHGLPVGHSEFFKSQFEQPSTSTKGPINHEPSMATPFPFVNAANAAAVAAVAVAASSNSNTGQPEGYASLQRKRKPDDYSGVMDLLPAKKSLKSNKQGNFKIFKDEPVPHGYLKFRFNEDCNFANCSYRNHQSHFHCRRNDCYYSFCDKTRFVQHTARHERLDKLMGDDFKQYRANMRCGYEDCAYNKNIGQNNKSSHFHCLKCNFICSDTNKVVAHRRQHSKMEFIRMAGFRKVANNEKCSSSDLDISNGDCTYSLKQTHYHCLVCDCSVLSRAQLGSHRHRSLS